jgi:hypothetical protein
MEEAAEGAHPGFRCFFSAEPINGAPQVRRALTLSVAPRLLSDQKARAWHRGASGRWS